MHSLDSRAEKALLFFISIAVALLNRWFVTYLFGTTPVVLFMKWYLNDIIGACGFCAYCDFMSLIFKKATINSFMLIGIIVVAGLFWEYITPMFRVDTTSDIYDLFAYVLGAAIYILIANALNIVRNHKKQ